MPILKFENLPSKETPITDKVLKELQTNLLKMVFPVGSIYWNEDLLVNPSEELGFGEWELREGVVFVGASRTDEDFALGKTGGEKKHTMTADEMYRHSHSPGDGNVQFAPQGSDTLVVPTFKNGNSNPAYRTSYEGAGQPFNVCQPYEVTGYAWVRIS